MSTQSTVHEAMDRFLDTVVRYKCVDREARVSYWRVLQAIDDRLYQEGLRTLQVHNTGSMYEGMPEEVCSDLDVMYTYPTYPVVVLELPGDSKQHQSGFVVAHGNTDQPAYLRLKVTDMQGISEEIVDIVNINNYVSSEMFVNSNVDTDQVNHGPAATGLAVPSHPDLGDADRVDCFHCPSWPPCASEFLIRHRPHGWPSQSLIDKIQQAGCHVVGVGHRHSGNKDTEWRWSFSVAEKELIHNIDASMYGCMYVLKAVCNKHWKGKHNTDQTQSNPFPSYFLKTACLWICESTSNRESVGACRVVIDWLISRYDNRVLPHYFISDQNLIGHLSETMCKKIDDWLVCVRGDLCRMIISSVTMVGDLPVVNGDICRQLQVSPVSPDCDCRELVSTLCVHDRAREVLEEATDKIKPESQWYRILERHWMGHWSSGYWDVIYAVIQERFNANNAAQAPACITIPETILLPIIDNIHTVVKDGYGDMFRQALYRYMGDCYHAMYAYYPCVCLLPNSSTNSLQLTCHDKAAHYYTLGREMVYPDGWSDKGLGGYVHLATFYYLSGQWSHLEASLKELEPLLEESKESVVAINGQSLTMLDTHVPLSLYHWKTDTDMYSLISTWDDLAVFLHPIPLGYYFLARFALRQGDRDGATRALHNIQGCVNKIMDSDGRKSTKCLINILKNQ